MYMQYSRLEFTKIEDRPIAISGLEKRLLDNFKTTGGYGVFEDNGTSRGWLRRSLLWRRGFEVRTMERIDFPVDRSAPVPTWSWMAYKGGINYLEPPLEKVDWESDEIISPWSSGHLGAARTSDFGEEIGLVATARDFDTVKVKGDSVIIYDIPGKTAWQPFKCIIIGRNNEDAPLEEKRHYVLIISPKISGPRGTLKTYARVGVGHLLGKCISYDSAGERVRVI
jgi:hypothetical protein